MYPDQYQIIFLACVISASVLVLFLHWRWKVRQRNRLAERHRDSAVIRLRTKSFQGSGCASSVRILKVDGEKADTFLCQWPWRYAVYVRPGMHSMEVRADWPVHTWHNEAVWFHYTVGTLPAVTVEAGAVYALEYEVKTDTWTLFRLEKDSRACEKESVQEKFIKPEGYVSDNHLWRWNAIMIIFWILGILFIKYW